MKLGEALILVELIKLIGRSVWITNSVTGITMYGVLMTEVMGACVTLYLLFRDRKRE